MISVIESITLPWSLAVDRGTGGPGGGNDRQDGSRVGKSTTEIGKKKRTEEEISYLMSSPQSYHALANAVGRLVEGTAVLLYHWAGDQLDRMDRLGWTDGSMAKPTEWERSGMMAKLRPYHPRKPFPMANRCIDFSAWSRVNPDSVRMLKELGLEEMGFGPHCETFMFQRSRFVASCMVVRPAGDIDFEEDEVKRIQQIVPMLNEVVHARQILENERLDPGTVVKLADAFDGPALIATP